MREKAAGRKLKSRINRPRRQGAHDADKKDTLSQSKKNKGLIKMTKKEQEMLNSFIDSCKSYPHATQYDKGEPVWTKDKIEMIKIFIKGLND